jgi:hypothetical protein
MAYKQSIPESWKRQKPNIAKFPHIYNLDAAVGLNCPNRRLDVMLIQYMLQVWAMMDHGVGYSSQSVGGGGYGPDGNVSVRHSVNPKSLREGGLPVTGVYDNRTLAWIFNYQLINWQETSQITGKVTPAASDGSSLNERHTLLRLNLQIGAPDTSGKFAKEFVDINLEEVSYAPADLRQALKDAR